MANLTFVRHMWSAQGRLCWNSENLESNPGSPYRYLSQGTWPGLTVQNKSYSSANRVKSKASLSHCEE